MDYQISCPLLVRPRNPMRTVIAFISLILEFALQAAPPTTNEFLQPSQYSVAEAIYQSFLPGAQWSESKTNFVYCLSFGASDGAMPPDFMARFPGPMPRVITGTNELAFPMPGVMTERKSGRKVVRLMLHALSLHGDHAESQVFYTTGSEVVTETIELTQQDNRWNVIRMKEEKRTAF